MIHSRAPLFMRGGHAQPSFAPLGAAFARASNSKTQSDAAVGATNSGPGCLSLWFKPNLIGPFPNTFPKLLSMVNGKIDLEINYATAGALERLTFNVYGHASSANQIQFAFSDAAWIDNQWNHVAFSWDLNNAPGSRQARCLLNGELFTTLSVDAGAADLTRYTEVAAVGGSTGSANSFNGCIREAWLAAALIDLSVTANQRKFYSAAATPEYLGVQGELPTGNYPVFYLSDLGGVGLAPAYAASAWTRTALSNCT